MEDTALEPSFINFIAETFGFKRGVDVIFQRQWSFTRSLLLFANNWLRVLMGKSSNAIMMLQEGSGLCALKR